MLANITTIKEWVLLNFFPAKPTVGWLLVSSQGQLRCVVPDEMRFNSGDGKSVSVLKNACALETVAICVSYDGKNGNRSYVQHPVAINLAIYGDVTLRSLAVPPIPEAQETRGVGAAGCSHVSYGYPPP